MKKIIILFTLIYISTNGVFAQAGILDNTYGSGGKSITAVGNGNSEGWGMAIQNGWSVVVGGFAFDGVDSNFALVRYLVNGSIDSTFGVNGQVVTSFGGNAVIYAVATQQDGKIVAGGMAWNGSKYNFAVVRYQINGALDSTFGVNGIALTPVGAGNAKIHALAIDSDWSIVVGGSAFSGTDVDFALARYNTDGSLDTTFGTKGIVTTAMTPSTDIIFSLGFQADWSVVVGGACMVGTQMNFGLARYSRTGVLDQGFGVNGKVFTSIGDSTDLIWSVVVQPDQKIVAGGFSSVGANKDFALVRYNNDGSLDNSFGTAGEVVTDLGGDDEAIYALVRQPDGKFVAAGNSAVGNYDNSVLIRYNTNGTLDSTFGSNGHVLSVLSSGNNEAYAGVIQADGKIVTSGFATDDTGKVYFYAARYITGLALGIIDFANANNALFIYPNPIAQNATLEYTLKNDEIVTIKLMDMEGQAISTLINNEKQQAGSYKQPVVLSDKLASGSYLLVISSPEGQMSIKIVK